MRLEANLVALRAQYCSECSANAMRGGFYGLGHVGHGELGLRLEAVLVVSSANAAGVVMIVLPQTGYASVKSCSRELMF